MLYYYITRNVNNRETNLTIELQQQLKIKYRWKLYKTTLCFLEINNIFLYWYENGLLFYSAAYKMLDYKTASTILFLLKRNLEK